MVTTQRHFHLTPNRSFNWAAAAVLFLLLAGWVLVISIFSFTYNTWPILGFAGLELGGVALAFWLHAYKSRLYEEVVLTRDTVFWHRHLPSGHVHSWQAPLHWTKLTTRAPDKSHSPLTFTYAGKSFDFGHFLSPEDRGSFAAEFKSARTTLQAQHI